MDATSIVDYGLGNISAFRNVFRGLNLDVTLAQNAQQVRAARRLILPGVGAFDWAMARLEKSGMREALDEAVLGRRVPVLGVCVGMQMMANGSDEGKAKGLGWIEGHVERLTASNSRELPLPHMGWNTVVAKRDHRLLNGLNQPRFYFLHSYRMVPNNETDVLAATSYGFEIAAAVQKDNVIGTQFHPEKSHQWGIRLLKNFAEL
jgi:imidazole glycerol-phosphate synthase subunit HisH